MPVAGTRGPPGQRVDVSSAITGYLQSERRRAERDLVRFFNLSLDLFCIAHPNGYFDRVNENFTRVLGYSAAELTSHPFLEFVHPDDEEKTREVLGLLGRGEHCIQFVESLSPRPRPLLVVRVEAAFVPEEGDLRRRPGRDGADGGATTRRERVERPLRRHIPPKILAPNAT